jgi:hypothetical protein
MLNIIYISSISKWNVSIWIHFGDKKDVFLHFWVKKAPEAGSGVAEI